MRSSSMTRIALLLFPLLAVSVMSFYAGYRVGIRNATASDQTFLDEIEESIHPDTWLASGGTSAITPLPSNVTACTPEDIFGSREAYERMFDLPSDENPASDDPFGTSTIDDPFAETDSR